MNTTLPKIEKGIDIPSVKGRSLNKEKLTFVLALKKGDSFVVTSREDYNSYLAYLRRYKIKITTRSLGNNSYRIWKK